ncbi:lipid II-degrading bacteriocin [Azospirillum sp. SYSU D00513]|uniref:lipid II-degrading bacteriocin n=2 Tax=Pseudomonadati TaxID=3379134 RepID=UPI001A95E5E7
MNYIGTITSDTLVGSDADDYIEANDGDDVLDGRRGNDYIVGGGGRDVFVFAPGDGWDYIADFSPGTGGDVLDLRAYTNIVNFSELLSSAVQDGNDLVIALGDSADVRLQGVLKSSLHSENILLSTVQSETPTATNSYGENYTGTDQSDYYVGTAYNDVVDGGHGNDYLLGGNGRDTFLLRRGSGFDYIADFTPGAGGDILDLREWGDITDINSILNAASDQQGDVTLHLSATDTVRLEGVSRSQLAGSNLFLVNGSTGVGTGEQPEEVVGTSSFVGSAGKDNYYGTPGYDTINGNGGDDYFEGRAGRDTFILTLGNGHDYIGDFKPGVGGDILDLRMWTQIPTFEDFTGNLIEDNYGVTLLLDSQNTVRLNGVSLSALTRENVLTAAPAVSVVGEVVSGGQGGEFLIGTSGNDTLYGQGGFDWIKGGGGSDVFVYDADSGHDQIDDFTAGVGGDIIQISGDLSDITSTSLISQAVYRDGNTFLRLNDRTTIHLTGVAPAELEDENIVITSGEPEVFDANPKFLDMPTFKAYSNYVEVLPPILVPGSPLDEPILLDGWVIGGGTGWGDVYTPGTNDGQVVGEALVFFNEVHKANVTNTLGMEWTNGFLSSLQQISPNIIETASRTIESAFKAFMYADQVAQTNDVTALTVIRDIGQWFNPRDPDHYSPFLEFTLSGKATSPIAALGHYLYGNGETLTLPLEDVGLNFTADEIPGLLQSLAEGRQPGIYPVSEVTAYSTDRDSLIAYDILGDITLRHVGTLQIFEDYSWDYKGVVRAFHDQYDFNPSDRDWSKEGATWLGSLLPGTVFQIAMPGELDVHFSGPPTVTIAPVIINGGEGNDNLGGNAGNDAITGLGGDDVISTGAGNDLVFGNQGNDIINAGFGSDTVHAGQGDDIIYSGSGDDSISANIGGDLVYGNEGHDIIFGNQGNDTIYGGRGNDTIFAGLDSDMIYGDIGSDALWGDIGSDTLVGGADADRFNFNPNTNHDVIQDFNFAEGDRISLNGLGYSLVYSSAGMVINLSDGGSVLLAGYFPVENERIFV